MVDSGLSVLRVSFFKRTAVLWTMGIDLEFDKYCIVVDKKLKQDFTKDMNFHRFRTSSCKSLPSRNSIYQNTPIGRRKIEISSSTATPFTFFEILDSCCNSEGDDDDENNMKGNDIVSSSDGFLEISFDSPDHGIRNFESAEQRGIPSEETEDPKLFRFDPPGNCLSETDNSNTSTPSSIKENESSGMRKMKKKKNTFCRSLLNEFSDTSSLSKESGMKLFSPAHLQGFLKVENKNGLLPSFEFSMNFPGDILIAQTLKTEDSTKWAYTFSSSGNRRKSRKGGGTPPSSVLAQMQVSNSPSLITECVVYDRMTNLHPNTEIVAIEIESTSGRVNVITGAGRHGVPPSGDSIGPSSLLERWRSGGGCDCGGWDMACSLTVLTNPMFADDQHCFQLFVQGAKDAKMPALSIGMIGEGRYSVEFHARLSTLQAFSICIAMLHSTLVLPSTSTRLEQREKPFLARDQMKVFAEEEVIRIADERRRTEMNKHVSVNPVTFVIVPPPFSPIARV